MNIKFIYKILPIILFANMTNAMLAPHRFVDVIDPHRCVNKNSASSNDTSSSSEGSSEEDTLNEIVIPAAAGDSNYPQQDFMEQTNISHPHNPLEFAQRMKMNPNASELSSSEKRWKNALSCLFVGTFTVFGVGLGYFIKGIVGC